jgi:hypothetical protein
MVSHVPVIRSTDHVLSMNETAKLVGLSRHGLMLAVLRGELPAREIAGRWVVREQDAEAFRTQRGKRSKARSA